MKISDSSVLSNLSTGASGARQETPHSKPTDRPALAGDSNNAALSFELPSEQAVNIDKILVDPEAGPAGGSASEYGKQAHNQGTHSTGTVKPRTRA